MIPLIRAECRKVLTLRSTYVISGLAIVLVSVLSFFMLGGFGADPDWLPNILGEVSTIIGIFVAFVAILLMGHEYRYSTIMYTLTSANSRTKVLLAKIVTVVGFALSLLFVVMLFASIAYMLGVYFSPVAGRELTMPTFFWNDLGRAVFYVVAYGLIGLLFACLFRHLVGAIAALFVAPTIEILLSIVLKGNTKYLPFVSLENVHASSSMSAGKAALLLTIYLVVGWIAARYLFIRRDAN